MKLKQSLIVFPPKNQTQIYLQVSFSHIQRLHCSNLHNFLKKNRKSKYLPLILGTSVTLITKYKKVQDKKAQEINIAEPFQTI